MINLKQYLKKLLGIKQQEEKKKSPPKIKQEILPGKLVRVLWEENKNSSHIVHFVQLFLAGERDKYLLYVGTKLEERDGPLDHHFLIDSFLNQNGTVVKYGRGFLHDSPPEKEALFEGDMPWLKQVTEEEEEEQAIQE